MDDIERPPWWLSNAEPGDNERPAASGDSASDGSWMTLLGSLGSLAGQWWESSGAADHASHGDPADHPECIVCRAMATLATPVTQPRSLPAVRWLPIRRL